MYSSVFELVLPVFALADKGGQLSSLSRSLPFCGRAGVFAPADWGGKCALVVSRGLSRRAFQFA